METRNDSHSERLTRRPPSPSQVFSTEPPCEEMLLREVNPNLPRRTLDDAFSMKTTHSTTPTGWPYERTREVSGSTKAFPCAGRASQAVRLRAAAGKCDSLDHRQRDRQRSLGAESSRHQRSIGRWCRESHHSTGEDSLYGLAQQERGCVDGIAVPSKRVSALSQENCDRALNRDQPSIDHCGR